MNLHLYSIAVRDALLLRKGFSHSHMARIVVRGLDLDPNVTNPALMNSYKNTYDRCTKFISFPNVMASHDILTEAAKEDCFSGFSFSNTETAVGIAVRTLLGDDEALKPEVLRKLTVPQGYVF
jgi:hypothetical protein